MLSCKEISRLVSESLDRNLPLGKRMGVRMHLMMCSMCRAYEKQILLLRNAVRSYGRQNNDKLSDAARRQIKSVLEDNAE